MKETKASESEKVDAYMASFKHPLKAVLEELRKIILAADESIGEEIKWNAPTFFYTGPLPPSGPKLYERYLAVSNIHRKEYIMLVLPHGAGVDDGSGFLEGDYADGRRIVKFYNLEEVEAQKQKLQKLLQDLVKQIAK